MKIEMVNKKFGRLTVIEDVGADKRQEALWRCLCECGNIIVSLGGNLRSGHTKSCGCLKKELAREALTTHGKRYIPEYKIWADMIQRCTNQKRDAYKNYGGRGIAIDKKWMSFEFFYKDMGDRPSKLYTIERIDNDKGYYKENCKWATYTEQSRNKRIGKNNTTGRNGVNWVKETKKYRAEIMVNYKSIYLGCFTKLEDAAMARQEAEREYWGG